MDIIEPKNKTLVEGSGFFVLGPSGFNHIKRKNGK